MAAHSFRSYLLCLQALTERPDPLLAIVYKIALARKNTVSSAVQVDRSGRSIACSATKPRRASSRIAVWASVNAPLCNSSNEGCLPPACPRRLRWSRSPKEIVSTSRSHHQLTNRRGAIGRRRIVSREQRNTRQLSPARLAVPSQHSNVAATEDYNN